jgi:hypothetical protein
MGSEIISGSGGQASAVPTAVTGSGME